MFFTFVIHSPVTFVGLWVCLHNFSYFYYCTWHSILL